MAENTNFILVLPWNFLPNRHLDINPKKELDHHGSALLGKGLGGRGKWRGKGGEA